MQLWIKVDPIMRHKKLKLTFIDIMIDIILSIQRRHIINTNSKLNYPNSLLVSIKWFHLDVLQKYYSNDLRYIWMYLPTNSKVMSPFHTWSLRKWHLLSIYLVLEYWTIFLEILMALVLSHFICTRANNNPKSLKIYFI